MIGEEVVLALIAMLAAIGPDWAHLIDPVTKDLELY